jgi:hypothetical protein
MSLSVLQAVLQKDPLFKHRFLQIGGFSFFAEMDLSTVRPSNLPAFAGVVAECLHANFPTYLEVEPLFALLAPLLAILSRPDIAPPAALAQAARGCFYFVEPRTEIPRFVAENCHCALVRAFGALAPDGQAFALSTFGFCFRCDECAEQMSRDVPIALFMETLAADDEDARIDAAIALANVCGSQAVRAEHFLGSGLFEFILKRLPNEIFVVKEKLFAAVECVVVTAHSQYMDAFLRPELLEQMQEGIGCLNSAMGESIVMIATALLAATTADECVTEFLELCADGGL